MKTPIISLLAAAGFLTLVSCTNLTSAQNPNGQNPNINPQVSDHERLQVPANSFAADLPLDPDSANSQILMDAILERIGELPEDGEFGLGRMYVSTHGFPYEMELTTNSAGKKSFEVLSKNHFLLIRSWSAIPIHGKNPRIHRVANKNSKDIDHQYLKNFDAVQEEIQSDTPAVINDFLKSKADSLQIPDKSNPKIVLELQKSYATSPKCYSCHEGIREGEPIGVIGIKRIPLDTIK